MGEALSCRGVTVTFVTLSKYIAQIRKLYTDEQLEKQRINLVGLDGVERGNIFEKAEDLKLSFKPYFEELLRNQKAGKPGPTCVMADRFLFWTKLGFTLHKLYVCDEANPKQRDVAMELQIGWYLFFSNGSIEARLHQYSQKLYSEGSLRISEGTIVGMDNVSKAPGLEFLRAEDLPWSRWAYPEETKKVGEFMVGADGLVLNTFEELERSVVNSLRENLASGSHRDALVFTIGPLSSECNFSVKSEQSDGLSTSPKQAHISFLDQLEDDGQKCVNWLNQQPPSSVLYVCFGTVFSLEQRQIEALAVALEDSQERFVWVLRRDSTDAEDVLPPNYETRIGDRGLVLGGWVPQPQLLTHPSIWGFLSHCGWSSCLDSVKAGVPVLAWPQGADQHANARLLESVWKTAILITQKKGDAMFHQVAADVTGKELDMFVDHDELEAGIRLLMRGQEGRDARERAIDLRRKANAAVDGSDGSSVVSLQRLVDHIQTLRA
ncbi:hypothetical protein AXG93_2253s1140 [Marchantia polymorpha subsp. ruderalis]|uniref:Glycosyltransferase n=1 Tax=Marchantia polymorpha subsp. ruderalis TaxID=1480154 RepID=A0A176VTH4_MARPO|nr:hypothetical protein AXG93_2253s1140 [Marchantia polymorpha subsp. ruderalis]